MPVRHMVWDWNGTLWDDHAAACGPSAQYSPRWGLPRADSAAFRDYTRPWKGFFERFAGRSLAQDEWLAAEGLHHETYNAQLDDIQPARDATEALRLAAEGVVTQSVLSMWRHDLLLNAVTRHGLYGYMSKVDGRSEQSGGPKAGFLATHLGALGLAPADAVVVGDSLDDLAAPRAVGAACVLYDGGTHHRTALAAAHPAVATTLVETLVLGGVLASY